MKVCKSAGTSFKSSDSYIDANVQFAIAAAKQACILLLAPMQLPRPYTSLANRSSPAAEGGRHRANTPAHP